MLEFIERLQLGSNIAALYTCCRLTLLCNKAPGSPAVEQLEVLDGGRAPVATRPENLPACQCTAVCCECCYGLRCFGGDSCKGLHAHCSACNSMQQQHQAVACVMLSMLRLSALVAVLAQMPGSRPCIGNSAKSPEASPCRANRRGAGCLAWNIT